VTGQDIGCGTGRYTRLLRRLPPEGSLLLASDVSAAVLAQLTADQHGQARGVMPLRAAAEQLPVRAASLDLVTAVQLRSPPRSSPLPGLGRPGAAARRPTGHLHPHATAERANDLGPLPSRFHRDVQGRFPGPEPEPRHRSGLVAGRKNPFSFVLAADNEV
jgi:SAM-dependent methyltransferase